MTAFSASFPRNRSVIFRRPLRRRAGERNITTILNVHLLVTLERRVEIVLAARFVRAETLPVQPLARVTPLGRTIRPVTV